MAAILFLDTGSHVEFLDAVAARLESMGHPAWIAAPYPRENQLYRKFAPKRVAPASPAEIDAMPAGERPAFLSAAREEEAVSRLVSSARPDGATEEERTLWRERFRRLCGWFHQFIQANDVGLVVCWNGVRMRGAAIAEAARAAGAKILYAENGYFPKTIQLDPKGVNAAASIASLSGEYFDREELDEAEWNALVAEYENPPRPDRPLRDLGKVEPPLERWWRSIAEKIASRSAERRAMIPEAEPEPWLEGWRRRQAKAALRAETPFPTSKLPKRYVVVPLQVRTDTQILDYSPNVRDMATLVHKVVGAAKSIDPELVVVAKEHPKDAFSHPELEREATARGVVWIRSGDLRAILRGAAAVVTVNSTVGVEALLLGAPVVTLGQALFNKEGIVHYAETLEELPARLRDALAGERQPERVKKFLVWLRRVWLARAHPRFLDEESISNAAEAILERGFGESKRGGK